MLGIPSFNGVEFFGQALTFNGVVLERASQRVALAGVDGLASLDLGFRGYQTTVEGTLYGAPFSSLRGLKALWESYRDGRPYVLVDNGGISWPDVILEDFRQTTPVGIDPKWGYYFKYTATFLHLSYLP